MEHAASDWFPEEALCSSLYLFTFSGSIYAAAAAQVGPLLALAGLAAGTVLDLACGPGRHAVPLAQRGFTVTGVDCTPFLLDKARAYAAAAGVQIEWVQEDMRRFMRPNTFDLAINLSTSF